MACVVADGPSIARSPEANHRCLAAPIFDFSGDAIAAVGVSGSNADMPESEFETMAHSVVKAARNISLSMGYVM